MEPDLDRLLTQLASEEPALKDAPLEKTFLYLVLKVERQKCQLQAAESELKELRRERDEAQNKLQVGIVSFCSSGVARALPEGRAVHLEDQNEEEYEANFDEKLEKPEERLGNVLICPPGLGVRSWLRPCSVLIALYRFT